MKIRSNKHAPRLLGWEAISRMNRGMHAPINPAASEPGLWHDLACLLVLAASAIFFVFVMFGAH